MIGKSIIDELHRRNYSKVSKIYILNDTNALASYTVLNQDTEVREKIPGSLVAGTGDNMSLRQFNLEAGRKPIKPDELWELMSQKIWGDEKKSLIPEGDGPINEHRIGGDFIRYRLLAALKVLIDKSVVRVNGINEIINRILTSDNQSLISSLASEEAVGIADKSEYQGIVKEGALRALGIAGQCLGIMIASLVKALNLNPGKYWLSVEGGVIEKGYQVLETVNQTLETLIPDFDIKLIPGSGLIGIAQLAMVNNLVS